MHSQIKAAPRLLSPLLPLPPLGEKDSPPPVLLAEDDPNDIFFTQFAWAQAEVPNPLVVCEHGGEAIEYFSGTGDYGDRLKHPLPCLLLADMNMPRVDGFALLKWLQEQRGFAALPKIIFSCSYDPEERRLAKSLGAADYLIKPLTISEREAVIRHLASKWLTTSQVTAARPIHS